MGCGRNRAYLSSVEYDYSQERKLCEQQDLFPMCQCAKHLPIYWYFLPSRREVKKINNGKRASSESIECQLIGRWSEQPMPKKCGTKEPPRSFGNNLQNHVHSLNTFTKPPITLSTTPKPKSTPSANMVSLFVSHPRLRIIEAYRAPTSVSHHLCLGAMTNSQLLP